MPLDRGKESLEKEIQSLVSEYQVFLGRTGQPISPQFSAFLQTFLADSTGKIEFFKAELREALQVTVATPGFTQRLQLGQEVVEDLLLRPKYTWALFVVREEQARLWRFDFRCSAGSVECFFLIEPLNKSRDIYELLRYQIRASIPPGQSWGRITYSGEPQDA